MAVGTAQLLPSVQFLASEGPNLCAPGPVGLRRGGGGVHRAESRRGDERKSTEGEGEG